jgi:hypothetical protein
VTVAGRAGRAGIMPLVGVSDEMMPGATTSTAVWVAASDVTLFMANPNVTKRDQHEPSGIRDRAPMPATSAAIVGVGTRRR